MDTTVGLHFALALAASFASLCCTTRESTLNLQLQQKASEVDSSRVSSAIQNLINSWKASDSDSDQDTATSSSTAQASDGPSRESTDMAKPSGRSSSPNGSGPGSLSEDDQRQQAKRSRLLTLFSRGRNGSQQPEELMPLRVRPPVPSVSLAATVCLDCKASTGHVSASA